MALGFASRPGRREAWITSRERGELQAFVAGAAAGAGLAYMFDERSGRRRRKLLSDRLTRTVSRSDDAVGKVVRDSRNRLAGAMAAVPLPGRSGDADDRVLQERIRQEVRRASSHPRAIDVRVEAGRVTLAGPVLVREAGDLVARVRGVRGVREVENRLRPGDQESDPALQGEPRGRRGRGGGDGWSPAVRAGAGLAGAGVALYGAWRGDLPGAALGVAGIAAVCRAVANRRLGRLTGITAGQAAVELQKTIEVRAPRARVFELWTDPTRFPEFMRHVREVRDLGGGRSRWLVRGPLGMEVGWDAEVTRAEPEERLAWRTVPGSLIQHTGFVTFRDAAGGGTQVNIHLSYNPAIGAAGHLLAQVLGADPKAEMDEDLVRMQFLLETGRTPARAARAQS